MNKKKRIVSLITAVVLALGTVISVGTASVSATENSLTSKVFGQDVVKGLNSKVGMGYYEVGQCSGYVCSMLKDYYDCGWTRTNGYVADIRADIIARGVSEVEVSQARPGDIVTFGDQHIAIVGEDMELYHAINRGVVHQYTIEEFELTGGNKKGDARVFRGFSQEIPVEVTVTKESEDKAFVEDNNCYSLAGAKYGIYSGATLLKTITTDNNGVAKGTVSVMPSVATSLTIKEISPSKGYGKDTNVYTRNGSSGKINIVSKEPPVGDPITVLLYKADKETGKFFNAGELKEYYPQKAGSLAGAIFKVDFYGDYCDLGQTVKPRNINKPLRTWYVETDENGYVRLGEKWLAKGYEQSDFYIDKNTGIITLPLGTIAIKEIVAPEGYLLNDKVFISEITQTGENVIVNTYQEPIIEDQIKRGDIDFIKVADDSQKRLANVPFMITSLNEDGIETADGESHIIVTDENGYASTESTFNAHSDNTNANDKAWNGSGIDESKLNSNAGIWFGELEALNEDKGALPYGKYRLDELPCKANEGYKLVENMVVDISRDGYIVSFGTITDKKSELKTSLWDSDINEERVTLARENITLTDRVRYENLEVGEEYNIKGILMDKETEAPIIIDGQEVKSTKSFVAKKASGTVDMKFTFDSSTLRGKEVVAFESLEKDGIVIATHEDIDDLDQTIEFLNPRIGTTAIDKETESHYSASRENVTIIDEITYENLLRGYTYEVTGTLMDKETGKPIVIDGQEVKASKILEPNKSNGKLKMEFNLNSKSIEGKSTVVYEEICFDGEIVAEHKDINDEGQTIYFPQIKTRAIDEKTEDHISYADDKARIIDTVSYMNIKPDEEYICEGSLIDKSTGKVIASSTATFIPKESKGTVDVIFEFDASLYAGKDVVVFESLMLNDKIIATHIDINDEGQTVNLPLIKTSASDKETSKKEIEYEKDKVVIITDTVQYYNLIKGKEYSVCGRLIDKSTGKILTINDKEITAEKTFVAEGEDGEVTLDFIVDITELKGKNIVAFEKIYLNDEIVGAHEDISDKNQTVKFVKPVPVPKTGDNSNMKVYLAIALGALLLGTCLAVEELRRKKKSNVAEENDSAEEE